MCELYKVLFLFEKVCSEVKVLFRFYEYFDPNFTKIVWT